MLSTVQARSH